MNAYAMFAANEALRLANERLEGFRLEQANHRRAAAAPKRSAFAAIASAVSSFRAAASAVDTDHSIPALTDYPYRS
jgi:hypothetical protein